MTETIPHCDRPDPLPGDSAPSRMTARARLQSLITRRERELAGWRALLASLPQTLPHEADEALWQLLVGSPTIR